MVKRGMAEVHRTSQNKHIHEFDLLLTEDQSMIFFRSSSSREVSLGLAALRIAVGTIFIRHGAQKLFTFGFAGVIPETHAL